MKTLLHLQDLEKSFGRQMVLDHVGFDLQPGEIIGLIGPSGAGKSTMIKTMLGMEKADSGMALVLDHTMPNRHILGDIGYMAQSDALYEALSGQENLEFFGQLKGLSKKVLKDKIAHVAQVVDLTEHLNKAVSGYSGGMKRRLSLAIDFRRTNCWNRPFASKENLERVDGAQRQGGRNPSHHPCYG